MNTALHRVDPPSTTRFGGLRKISAGATASRLGRPAGLPNRRDDGWGSPRWAQAEELTGGYQPVIAEVLITGTKLPLP